MPKLAKKRDYNSTKRLITPRLQKCNHFNIYKCIEYH